MNQETEVRVGIGGSGGDVGKGGRREEVDDDALQTHVQVWVNEGGGVVADLVGEGEEHVVANVGLIDENGDAGVALLDGDADVADSGGSRHARE